MNNEIILQSLTDSFEVLKDLWKTKKEAIINCIVETEAHDGSLSMDMWLYILQHNRPINNEEVSRTIIEDVFERFFTRNDSNDYADGEKRCRTIFTHVTPHMIFKEELINEIFGQVVNAGYCVDKYDKVQYIPMCIAGIILEGTPQIASKLIKVLSMNKKLKDVSIGQLLKEANDWIELANRSEYTFGRHFEVSPIVKEALLHSLEYINDEISRAECTIAILSL